MALRWCCSRFPTSTLARIVMPSKFLAVPAQFFAMTRTPKFADLMHFIRTSHLLRQCSLLFG